MTLFARARLNLNLTPAERALLRLLEGMLIGAVVAGAQAVLPLLNDAALAAPENIAWGSALHTFMAAFVAALILAARKYLAAQADPALPAGSGPSATAAASPDGLTNDVKAGDYPPGLGSAEEMGLPVTSDQQQQAA